MNRKKEINALELKPEHSIAGVDLSETPDITVIISRLDGAGFLEKQVTTKEIEAAGVELGRKYAALRRGFINGLKEEQEAKEATESEEERPKDCINCWCNECAELEECVVEKEGYTSDSRPMPCDGCNRGMRYMPKEKPPCECFKPASK